jgi:hypothetical protein
VTTALLEAPPTMDVLVGRLQPGDQLMLPELPRISPVTYTGRTHAPDGRWFVTFTNDGAGQGSVLRDIDAHVTVRVA